MAEAIFASRPIWHLTRIREARTLRTANVYNRKGTPRSDLIIRKEKLATALFPSLKN